MSSLRPHILETKQRLADGHAEFLRRHEAGCSGVELCAAISDLRDAVLLDLTESAMADLNASGPNGLWREIALVAHGGYGRRDVAPSSDVDLMILHASGAAARVAPLAERLLRDVFDVGLTLGHSVRTPEQACRMACGETMVCTSLIESRLLRGSADLFARCQNMLRRQTHRHARRLMAGIQKDREEERLRYGETVFLLEPNVKRSRGALRDIQWIRWIGFVRYGTADFRRLSALGDIHKDDVETIDQAGEFLLRLRNELHFHAGQAADVLSRAEQVRIAELRGYAPLAGLLPVEQFMRDYFRHTEAVSRTASRFAAKAQTRDRMGRLVTVLFGHRVEHGLHAGPGGIIATRAGLRAMRGNLDAVIRLIDLANLYDQPIAGSTWDAIRRDIGRISDDPPSTAACRHFLSLLSHPARLGSLLRDMHGAGLLERFIPAFQHARGLLQFNQYHQYTVDEHCLRAVEFAADLMSDAGPVGRVYRAIGQKHLLHLALLIHDLGKGHLEDHREVGLTIASETGLRLGLSPAEIESLRFLVHKHMMLNHLAFRRDTADEQLAVQLAVQIGSPELLQMLYVLTAADLSAVGPDVWDGWKTEVVTDLYHRTMQHLAGESVETTVDSLLGQRLETVRALLGRRQDEPWFAEHLDALPTAYFNAATPEQVVGDLQLLANLTPNGVSVVARYQPETDVVQCTVATSESATFGIFYKLTGALGSLGLQVRSAEIHTFSDGLVLDRFWVFDPDFVGVPPAGRLREIESTLLVTLQNAESKPPTFRRTWQAASRPAPVPGVPTRVNIDNSTSGFFTIIDVFTHDRAGLLYAVAQALFELGLSVGRAKIGTYLDQVVDVFYVTDRENNKIKDADRLDEIRNRLLDVVEREG
jgi:[protein-PII] uridylyltransferase